MGQSYVAEYALTILNDIGHVQHLCGQNARIHFKVLAKAWHLDDETARYLF